MSPRSRSQLAFLSALAFVGAAGAAAACGDSDKNTEPRSGPNGCIGDSCYNLTPPSGGGGPDGGVVSDGGDPLEGTTKAATLVVGGLGSTEGPVWVGGSTLLFSDVGNDKILELAGAGTTDFRTNSGGANGNAIDSQGRLVTCEGNNKRVVRSAATMGAGRTTIASTYQDAALNSPNDVIGRADGNIWFTDPDYKGGANKTQNVEGVYRISSGGAVSRLGTTGIQKPNGIALSPDGNTLYVVDNGGGAVFSVPLQANGSTNGAAFTKLIADTPGGDGMAVDDAGNLYVACSDGIRVFTSAGAPIGTVTVPEQPSNCTFGGTDRRTLYITAQTGLYSIVLNVPGLP